MSPVKDSALSGKIGVRQQSREGEKMAVRIGINGFGRIGMLVAKAAMSGETLEVVAVNDLMPFDSLWRNLFKHDSTHGIWPEDVSSTATSCASATTRSRRSPSEIPPRYPGATSAPTSSSSRPASSPTATGPPPTSRAARRRSIISAPAKGVDGTFVFKVNHEDYDPDSDEIVSNASCTTNCIIPMVKVLQDNFGIESGLHDDRARLHQRPEPARRGAQGPAARPLAPRTTSSRPPRARPGRPA